MFKQFLLEKRIVQDDLSLLTQLVEARKRRFSEAYPVQGFQR